MTTCACGKPGTTRQLRHQGHEYTIDDPCDACASANRERLDLLTADNPSFAVLERRILEPKS
jgi:hypothetical protein